MVLLNKKWETLLEQVEATEWWSIESYTITNSVINNCS